MKTPRELHIRIRAGRLNLVVASDGSVSAAEDAVRGCNVISARRQSCLLSFRLFGDSAVYKPVSVRRMGSGPNFMLEFDSAVGVRFTVEVVETVGYASFRLVSAEDSSGSSPVEVLYWGPLFTELTEPPGELVGIVRGGGFSVGMMSLDPGTDGSMVKEPGPGGKYWFPLWAMAGYSDEGALSWLKAEARDHTRDGVGANFTAIRGEPGRTVAGSAVAVYGCANEEELDVIEQIELAEGLPHPVEDGVWMKRSPLARVPDLWMHLDEKSIGRRIEMARRMGGAYLCSFLDMFGNWGHFDLDPGAWPSGMDGFRKAAQLARESGTRIVMYTLTCFLKPMTIAEPFIAPVPDDRLQTMGPPTLLANGVDAVSGTLVLENRPGLLEVLQTEFEMGDWLASHEENQAVRIDNEIIYYKTVRKDGSSLVLDGCHRGIFNTAAAAHSAGARVVRLYLIWYRNFYPGTLDMMDEVADNIASAALAGGFGRIQFDGHESCTETGHGIYARNRLTKRVYDMVKDQIAIFEGSNLGNYDWHVMSFIRWGEWDQAKGFRGTMIDSRIERQVMLRRNLMPNGLGQYYPSDATLEDIEWLMARAAGWNAGFDYHIHEDAFNKNPDRDAILDATRLWTSAMSAKFFTPDQLRGLRQTDRLYTLRQDPDGTFNLQYRHRWLHPGLKILPPSVFRVSGSGDADSAVEPCSIDWGWTHNPGIYRSAGLSDDLVCGKGKTGGSWTAAWPQAEGEKTDAFQFVIRLGKESGCSVRNPVVRCGADISLHIPAVLQPGQYLSVIHMSPWACIYDENHDVVSEVYIPVCGLVPSAASEETYPLIARGVEHSVTLSCEPDKAYEKIDLLMNLRTHIKIKD